MVTKVILTYSVVQMPDLTYKVRKAMTQFVDLHEDKKKQDFSKEDPPDDSKKIHRQIQDNIKFALVVNGKDNEKKRDYNTIKAWYQFTKYPLVNLRSV